MREPTAPRMSTQVQHAQSYASNRGQIAAQNHGRPATPAVSRPIPADRNVQRWTLAESADGVGPTPSNRHIPTRPTDSTNLAVLDVATAQIMGFHRSLEGGVEPDCRSGNGVISRAVGKVCIHGLVGTAQ